MSTYYDIFGCSPDAPIEEIKIKYRQLSTMLHPDKHPHCHFKCRFTYDEVEEAWNTLKDTSTRDTYDETLEAQRLNEATVKFGSFLLSEMEYNSTNDSYSVLCSCGNYYKIYKRGSEEFDSCIVQCDKCSMIITVDMKK